MFRTKCKSYHNDSQKETKESTTEGKWQIKQYISIGKRHS